MIPIEELKVFLGHNLQCICENKYYHLKAIDLCDNSVSISIENYYCSISTNLKCVDFIVRPMSHFNCEIEKDEIKLIPANIMGWSSQFNPGDHLEDPYQLCFKDMDLLASWGFDIFNWIGRGLAGEQITLI